MSDSHSLRPHPTTNPNYHASPPAGLGAEMKIKVVGVGGAGTNALDRLVLEGSLNIDLVACNTNVQALAGSVAAHKIQLGRHVTRGLGAGGDPEVGFAAAEEAVADLRAALQDMPLVLVCTGLGGGTGSGAAPLVVKLAREQGSLVMVVATLPFSFEGKRRGRQAREALAAVEQYADAVICFENDRMGELISSDANVHEAFAGADQIIGQAVRAVIDLVNRRGLIRLGFDDLLTALRNHDSRCLFGYGEAGGRNRAGEALGLALHSPLMDRGTLLGAAGNVLVNIVGGQDLTLAEVQSLMEELSTHIGDQTQLLFGAAVDPKLDGRLSVTLISSLSARPSGAALPGGNGAPATTGGNGGGGHPHLSSALVPAGPAVMVRPVGGPADADRHPALPPVPPDPYGGRAVAGAPRLGAGQPHPAHDPAAAGAGADEGGASEGGTRGRFDRSEPTIVDGEDLDVPTFLRKNFKLK